MTYSIIIPAYNEAVELPATLAAARAAMAKQSPIGELIVVDNNSTDGTGDIAQQHGSDLVIFEAVNQISRARNAGAKASTGDYLIFVDADTRITAELLTQTLSKLEAGFHVGGGAVVHFEQATSAIGRWAIATWERLSRLTQTAAGSYLFCLREAFEAEGGFDEKLYASEEVRMSNRLKRWGKRNGKRRFEILTENPVLTSARKLEWYSGPQMLGYILLAPLAVRSRRLCAFWYKRPEMKT
ncbi:MAG: glycosyltransferase [Coraliomargarita sp.]|nr:glycosyltransferase [Coraliomargarita sp.]